MPKKCHWHMRVRIGIPGFFNRLEAAHIEAFNSVKALVPGAEIDLLVFPQVGYDSRATRSLLSGLALVSNVHIIDEGFNISEDFLSARSINCVVAFAQNAVAFALPWPNSATFAPPRCVLQAGGVRPDLPCAVSLFHHRESPSVFSERPVDGAILSVALEAARRAPSAGNLQAYSLILVRNRGVMQRLADASLHQDKMAKCAGIFVFVVEAELSSAKYGKRGERLYALQDATIACSHLQLALLALGVGARWIGAFRDDDVAGILGTRSKQVAAMLIVGYPDGKGGKLSRRELDAYLTFVD